ncbi:MAG: hypothetical protein KBD00_05185 [Candidatus Peribacteraceae bacterium]|nr:hypothetical protein [Candidatus Peribacteraceae bacterium]
MPPFDYIDWGPEVEHRSGYTSLTQPAGVLPVRAQPQIPVSSVINDREAVRLAMATIVENNDQVKKIEQPTTQKAWTQAIIEKNHAKHASFVQARLDQMIRKNETEQLSIYLRDAASFDRSTAEAWASLINTPAYRTHLRVVIDPALYEFFRGLVRTKNPVAGRVPLHFKLFDEPIHPAVSEAKTEKGTPSVDPNIAWVNAQCLDEEQCAAPIKGVGIKSAQPTASQSSGKSWLGNGAAIIGKGLKAVGTRLHNDAQSARGIGAMYRAGLDITRYFQEEKQRKNKKYSSAR